MHCDHLHVSFDLDHPVPKKVIPPELVEKLKALEAKIIVGGENLIEKAELQQKLIEESEAELSARREKESKLAAELQQRQTEILQMEDSYATLQEEVVALNRKLKKAYGFLKESRAEYEDMSLEHEALRGELLDSIRTAEKEIKLTNALIGYYIPAAELAMIEANSNYNQMTGDWELRCIAYTGNNMKVSRVAGSPVPRLIEVLSFTQADFDLHENESQQHLALSRNRETVYLSYSSLNLNGN